MAVRSTFDVRADQSVDVKHTFVPVFYERSAQEHSTATVRDDASPWPTLQPPSRNDGGASCPNDM
jgi:hypothetical protein